MKKIPLLLLLPVWFSPIYAAFPAGTLIKTERSVVDIGQADVGDVVACMDSDGNRSVHKIMHKRVRKVHKYITIVLDDDAIITTVDQRLYLPKEGTFKEAQHVKAGDLLLTYEGEHICIRDIFVAEEEKVFFDITVNECHNFFVSRNEVLVHNVAPIVVGLSWIFGEGAINFAGASLGTALLGSVIGIKIKRDKEKGCIYSGYNAQGDNFANDAQAPGKPTLDDGYEPPKNWDGKKVKNPNGPGYGYPDRKGHVWVPSGPNGHGGPHWDVQYPNGDYENIVPGGRIRGKK